MFDIEHARYLMIEQQIRPWSITDSEVLDLLAVVKRENFVPPAYRHFAFADMEIPLDAKGQAHMFAPKVEAKILQALALKKQETILEIGTGSAYMSALLAYHARQVVSIEANEALVKSAKDNLHNNAVLNVEVLHANGGQGYSQAAPYDVIVASGAVTEVPDIWLKQLKVGGRLCVIVGQAPVMQVQMIRCIAPQQFQTETIFETVADYFEGINPPAKFSF